MYVYCRLFKLVLLAPFRPKQDPLVEIRTNVWIWPNDLDFNLHVNNGRYLTLFDLGRMDLTLRTGLWRVMLTKRWLPVLSTASIRFRRSVGAFARVSITTRIVHWDEKWLFIEHRLEHGGEICAKALVKAVFRAPDGTVPAPRLFEEVGAAVPTPGAAPATSSNSSISSKDMIDRWREFEQHLT